MSEDELEDHESKSLKSKGTLKMMSEYNKS